MSKISYLFEKDLDKYVGLSRVSVLETVSDVATLIEVFEDTIKDIDFRKVKYVVKDSENYYYIVVSDRDEEFDLFSFIGDCFNENINVSSINAKYLFPSRPSRGIYESDIDDEEEEATSFLDEEELGFGSDNRVYELYQPSSGGTLKVDSKGIIIGRSPKKVDYLVRNNSIGRVHCNLYVDSRGKLMVHDFDSLNGTFVNNRKVHSNEDVEMHEGDILLLANEEFRVI